MGEFSTLDGSQVPDEAGIELQHNEPAVRHRALLLVAMQDHPERGRRAASRALSRTEGALRGWSRAWAWERRMSRESLTLQHRACRLYRELYYDKFGSTEIPHVEPHMSIPVLVAGTMPPGPSASRETTPENKPIGPSEARLIAETLQQKSRDSSNALDKNKADSRSRALAAARKLEQHASIIEGVLAMFAKDMHEKMQRTPSAHGLKTADLPKLFTAWREIQETLGSLSPMLDPGGRVEPSVRVRQAQLNGMSLIDARLTDAEELCAILRALQAGEQVAAEREALRHGIPSGLRALPAPSDDLDVADEIADVTDV